MKVNYAGAVSISTKDWPGKASVTIFFRGCPLRCPYCQNHPYLEGSNLVELAFVREKLKSSSFFVNSAVFSGGEPLMQAAIVPLVEFAKEKGFLVGIHTNGCYPERAAELIGRNLVDKFFIDIKAPPDDPLLYGKVAGCGPAVKKSPDEIVSDLAKTIALVDAGGIPLELRTTLIRGLIGSEAELVRIAAWIERNVKNQELTYVLQQGVSEHCMQERLRKSLPFSREEILGLAGAVKPFLKGAKIKIATIEEGIETL